MEKHSFQEVMKEWNRMCKAIQESNRSRNMSGFNYLPCSGCTLNTKGCKSPDIEDISIVEEEVMRWAALHSEHVYPTWLEWLEKQGICVERIKDYRREYGMTEVIWSNFSVNGNIAYIVKQGKANEAIPADIAEKLGLKPKEG